MGARSGVLLLLAFSVAGLLLYRPALDGTFVSDDAIYVADNPYVQEPTPGRLLEVVKPWGAVPAMIRNYAPVHLLLHTAEWRLLGARVRGYHVVNVLLHALAATLLALLFVQLGLDRRLAALGAAIFLAHPANVEAVAWISQLKSVSAMAFALAALLSLPRRPALATGLFAAALLAKASAAVALPFAGLVAWAGWPGAPAPRPGARWLGAWTLVFGLYAAAQIAAYATDEPAAPVDPDLLVRLMSSLAIAGRYLVMSASGLGLSAFHEPEPVRSALDPGLWLAAGALVLLGWRTLVCLRRRRLEAAWWIWAALSFLPVAQITPFRYPLADRYLYFMLPGLIGGALFAARDFAPLAAGTAVARSTRRAVLVGACALVGLFAVRTHDRAAIWQSPTRVVMDSALHYPNGTQAILLRAKSRAAASDVDGTVALLREAMGRSGWSRFDQLQADPAWRRVRDAPEFQALVAELASGWIAHFESRAGSGPSALELRAIAIAHEVRGDYVAAGAAYDRAIALGDSFEALLREERKALRSRAAAQARPPAD